MLQKLLVGSDYGEEAANSRAQDRGILGDSVHAVCQQEGLKPTPKDIADDTAQCHDQLPRSPATEQKPLTGVPDASFLSRQVCLQTPGTCILAWIVGMADQVLEKDGCLLCQRGRR